MWRKLLLSFSVITFAFGVLFTSIMRTAAIKYEFGQSSDLGAKVLGEMDVNIDYFLAYPGKVLPDHPLWPVKVIRDKIWFLMTTNPSKKAEMKLLFADKRLVSSKELFEKDKPELAFSTLTKAEKYLEEASAQETQNRKNGLETVEFLKRLSFASLKHAQVIEEILAMAPEDAKPQIIQIENYAKNVFETSRNALLEKGETPPENPFDWR